MLKATNLHKTFGKKAVVRGVSMEVEPGNVVGLLGPNGAGKTTCFYMIVGLIAVGDGQTGAVQIGEVDPDPRRRAHIDPIDAELGEIRSRTSGSRRAPHHHHRRGEKNQRPFHWFTTRLLRLEFRPFFVARMRTNGLYQGTTRFFAQH